MVPLKPNSISEATFKQVLTRYPSTVPEKLQELDTHRYDTIPATVTQRKADGDAYLEKGEVERLVEWKLKHGTFRPKLLNLVQSNTASLIKSTTLAAFKTLNPANPLPSLKILTELKGIGPATASLLLAVYAPDAVPFFSDELFRWVQWDESGKPGGWQRKIGYTNKEYGHLVEGAGKLRERLVVQAVEIEKVAWVLGKEGVDVDGNEDTEKPAAVAAKIERLEKDWKKTKKETEGVAKGVKRKPEDSKPADEGTRRRSRRKPGT
ncbi:hypothetical protein K469DRAFT_709028 [Zopfia rhizophila CBS 207.26]|uniref:Uncharacterized protein n=1 Tax=Zopfia rhizophila CBS 207.26 TaxID=1314779 RepID=A0A6A6E0V0_9PEZI|nr:hypothetical protein K469DRAFT_709028 [Zopfia rhizophila CBS 207.26]